MKSLLFLGLLVLVSCGDPGEETKKNTNKFNPEPVVGENFKLISQVCRSLEAKERVLDNHVQSGTLHHMDQTTITCNGAHSTGLNIPMQIINPSRDSYVYVYRGTVRRAPIEEVETRFDGVMEDICSRLADLRSPMLVGASDAMSISVINADNSCTNDFDHVCLHIERGPLDANKETFTSESKHSIRFRISGSLEGFYAYRKHLTSRGCLGEGEEQGSILSFR